MLSDFGHMLSVGAICFEGRFALAKKKWDMGMLAGNYSRQTVHMVAALADCRMALVGTS